MVSCRISSEKSYSPSMLMWAHDTGEWVVIVFSSWSLASSLSILSQFTCEVEIIPTNNAVFDEAVAGLGDFLIFLCALGVFPWISNRDGACKPVRQFDLVELGLDGLTKLKIVDVAQDKEGLHNLPKGLHGFIEAVLARIRIQPPKDVRCRCFLEFYGDH